MRSKKKLCTIIVMLFCLLFAFPANAAPKISNKTVTLISGQTKKLKVTGTKAKAKWSSNKKSIAVVSSNGKVTAKKKGIATITARIGNKKYYCKVTVETPSISKKSISITKGKKYTLKLNGTRQKVSWWSNKKSVSTVTSKGVISAKATGNAIISAKVGGKIYKCNVTVKNPPISLSEKEKTIYVNQSFDLTIRNTKSKVSWSTSNKNVASIKKISAYKYRITGKKSGSAKITAKIGGKKYTCNVNVKNKNNSNNLKNNITYTSQSTDYGVVIIAKNNYSHTVRLETYCIYYNNGVMVKKSNCYSVYLEPGRECALQAWVIGTEWDSYKVHMTAEKAENVITNASNIVVSSNFGDNYNVLASVRNNGKKVLYTNIAVVYYQNGRIVGYDNAYADVNNPGSVDYVELYHPYDRHLEDIYTDRYKIYVNYSYAYDWSY